MELVVLGAGSILPRRDFGCAGYALISPSDEFILFDCGPGSLRALGQAGLELSNLRAVVLSHYHPDHCLDLFALAFARRNPEFEPKPIEILGPAGLLRVMAGAEQAFGRWVRDPHSKLREVDLDGSGRGQTNLGNFQLSCVRTGHNPEALAWRADCPDGSSFAYSGDTPAEARVADLAQGADLFVCECSFPDDQASEGHLSPTSAAEMGRRSGCVQLLLSHFYPSMDPEVARAEVAKLCTNRVMAARDGMRLPLRV